MNNKRTWALSALCFAMFVALIATAYVLIPDGPSYQSQKPLNSGQFNPSLHTSASGTQQE